MARVVVGPCRVRVARDVEHGKIVGEKRVEDGQAADCRQKEQQRRTVDRQRAQARGLEHARGHWRKGLGYGDEKREVRREMTELDEI